MGPKPRKDIDWEAIQREYRAGASYTLIQKRAKKFPDQWQRDLTKRVRAAVRRKIASDVVVNDTVVTEGMEDAIIESAADRALDIVRRHRVSLSLTAAIEERIFKELATVDPLTTVTSKSASLHALVSAQEKRLRMERQAFGITDESKPDGDQITVIPIIFDRAGDQ
jgi:hypothetical protein